MAEKKRSSYISAKESRRITKFNRKVTKKLEKERADSGKDPKIGLSESFLRKKFQSAFVSPIYLMT